MFTLNLPSLGVTAIFDKRWRVLEECEASEDGVVFEEQEISNEDIVDFILFFYSMWTYLRVKVKHLNQNLLPDEPYEVNFQLPEGIGFDNEHSHTVSARPFGKQISYDDGAAFWTVDGMVELFEHLAILTGLEAPLVFGALHKNYAKEICVYLKASLTGECVKWSTNDKHWVEHTSKPEGKPLRTNVGITSYITEEGFWPDAGTLDLGIDLLSRVISGNYPQELLITVDESIFHNRPSPSNPVEESFAISSNGHRLLYFLNTTRQEQTPVEEPTLADIADVPASEIPMISFGLRGADTELFTGGFYSITGGTGTYSMFDITRTLSNWVSDYLDWGATHDDATVGPKAFAEYQASVSRPRVQSEPAKVSSVIPLQYTEGIATYAYSDVGWAPVYGSEKLYTNELRTPNGGTLYFVDKDVDMTTSAWERLFSFFIDNFLGCYPGLAAVKYANNEPPEEDSAFTGELTVADPKTMTAIFYTGGKWSLQEVDKYTASDTVTEFGHILSITGEGSISSRMLAELLAGAYKPFKELCHIRNEKREELCANSIFGSYEVLHQCLPENAYNTKPAIRTGFISDIDSPIVAYDGNIRLSHTAHGWHVNNIARDKTSKVSPSCGDYRVGYESGMVQWDDGVVKLLRDFLSLVADLKDEDIRVAREIEAAE